MDASGPSSLFFRRFLENAHFSFLKPYFERSAIERGDHSSSRRISKHGITLEMFDNLLTSLSERQKCNLINHLLPFYYYLLRKIGRGEKSSELQSTFVAFLDLYFGPPGLRSSCLTFLEQCTDSLGVEPQVILRMVPRRLLRFLLFGCLTSRHYARSSTLASGVIRNYGCLYEYDGNYYGSMFNDTLRYCILRWDRDLYGEIREDIFKGNLRMQLISEVLILLLDEKRDKGKEYLVTLWKSVPYPLLTLDEVVAHMTQFVYDDRTITEIRDEMYSKCNAIWPVPDVPQPRSLKHLSRVQIRKTLLVDTRVGDEAISFLDYPPILKRYLRLDSF